MSAPRFQLTAKAERYLASRRPTAAPATFPYAHRTLAEVDAIRRAA